MTLRLSISLAILLLAGAAIAAPRWHWIPRPRAAGSTGTVWPTSMWARYEFSGNVLDTSGNGNHGTVSNGALVYAGGIAEFTNKPYIALPTTFQTTNGTILLKIKPTVRSDRVWWSHKATRDVFCDFLTSSSIFRFAGLGDNPFSFNFTATPTNEWLLAGLSFASNSFYAVLSTNGGSTWATKSDLAGTMGGTLTGHRIGDYYSGGSPVSGYADEVQFYSRAMSTNEMTSTLILLGQ
jgi:hypothetical protein